MNRAELFTLLDELARGLAREAAMNPNERAAKAPQIRAWFAPRYERLKAAARAAPCPLPWRVIISNEAEDPPAPAPHPCSNCFTARYEAWRTARRQTQAVL